MTTTTISSLIQSQNNTYGGGFSYQYKTSAYTAKNMDGVLANTSGGAFTVQLPATPSAGYQVVIADSGNSWATNNLTVDPQAGNIIATQTAGTTMILDVSGAYILFVFDGTKWNLYALAINPSATSGTALLMGNGAGGTQNVTLGTNLSLAGTTLNANVPAALNIYMANNFGSPFGAF